MSGVVPAIFPRKQWASTETMSCGFAFAVGSGGGSAWGRGLFDGAHNGGMTRSALNPGMGSNDIW